MSSPAPECTLLKSEIVDAVSRILYAAAASSRHYLHRRAPLNNPYLIDIKGLTLLSANRCGVSFQGISMFILDPVASLPAQTKTLEGV